MNSSTTLRTILLALATLAIAFIVTGRSASAQTAAPSQPATTVATSSPFQLYISALRARAENETRSAVAVTTTTDAGHFTSTEPTIGPAATETRNEPTAPVMNGGCEWDNDISRDK